MTSLLRLFVLAALLSSGAIAVPSAQPRVTLERHEFLIHDFHTESGVVLPEARVVYTTLGTLNANGDNAVLLPSHYMATFSGYNWLIRGADPDRALDPAHDFLVLTELFGNGRSSSPSNTPEPYHGPPIPGHDDPRQRRSRASSRDRGASREASPRGRGVLDGRRTSLSMGREPRRRSPMD